MGNLTKNFNREEYACNISYQSSSTPPHTPHKPHIVCEMPRKEGSMPLRELAFFRR